MINKVLLIGNVGHTPEFKEVGTNNTPMARFSLATTRKTKGETETTWHHVTCWGRLAEIVRDYVAKGSRLYIEGRITYRQYEKEGIKMTATEIVAEQLQMLSSKQEQRQDVEQPKPEPTAQTMDFSSDVPF